MIPAFGDSIGRNVNKAELGLCAKLTGEALAEHDETAKTLADLADQYDRLFEAFQAETGGKPFGWGKLGTKCARDLLAKLASGPANYGRTTITAEDVPERLESGTPCATADR